MSDFDNSIGNDDTQNQAPVDSDGNSLGDLPTMQANESDLSLGELKTLVGSGASGRERQMESAELSEIYDVGEEVGRGGFATVYKAVDKETGEEVAIKRLKIEAADEQSVRRFKREARLIAEMDHPNIIGVHRIGEDSNGLYIVMEYVSGGSLKDYLKQHGRMPVRQAVKLVQAVCEGLAYAHRKNLVHRDIKPANILLAQNVSEISGQKSEVSKSSATNNHQLSTKDVIPKIADFGLSTGGFESDMSMSLSMSGTTMGTPYYMPPEQRQSSKNVNHTADIYAVGKTLYQMVTGDVPDNVDPDLIPRPAGLSRIINQCVKTRPEERFFSMDDLVKALDALVQRRRVLRPVFAGLLVVALVAGFGAYKVGAAREEQARVAQMAKEQQNQISTLITEAEAAFAQGDLDVAANRVSSVLSEDALHAGALALRKKIEQQADQRKVREVKARADVAFEDFSSLIDGQGDYFLDEFSSLRQKKRAAEAAYNERAWGEAFTHYQSVANDVEKSMDTARVRKSVLVQKELMIKAKKDAEQQSAVELASNDWKNALETETSAEGFFGRDLFEQAASQFGKAMEEFQQAAAKARVAIEKRAVPETKDAGSLAIAAEGVWRTDPENTYRLGQENDLPIITCLYASGIDEDATKRAFSILESDAVRNAAKGKCLLLKIDLSNKTYSEGDRKVGARVLTYNGVKTFPSVLLLDGSYEAEKVLPVVNEGQFMEIINKGL